MFPFIKVTVAHPPHSCTSFPGLLFILPFLLLRALNSAAAVPDYTANKGKGEAVSATPVSCCELCFGACVLILSGFIVSFPSDMLLDLMVFLEKTDFPGGFGFYHGLFNSTTSQRRRCSQTTSEQDPYLLSVCITPESW